MCKGWPKISDDWNFKQVRIHADALLQKLVTCLLSRYELSKKKKKTSEDILLFKYIVYIISEVCTYLHQNQDLLVSQDSHILSICCAIIVRSQFTILRIETKFLQKMTDKIHSSIFCKILESRCNLYQILRQVING